MLKIASGQPADALEVGQRTTWDCKAVGWLAGPKLDLCRHVAEVASPTPAPTPAPAPAPAQPRKAPGKAKRKGKRGG